MIRTVLTEGGEAAGMVEFVEKEGRMPPRQGAKPDNNYHDVFVRVKVAAAGRAGALTLVPVVRSLNPLNTIFVPEVELQTGTGVRPFEKVSCSRSARSCAV